MSAPSTTVESAPTFIERPVFLSAAGEDLFGMITEPVGAARGVGVVLLPGGDFVPATNRNRLAVRMARRLATLGFHTLRFDYHGVGESGGEIESYWLDRPFVEDTLAGVSCLQAQGVEEIVLVGECFGARTALASAEKIPRLGGVALFATPVSDFRMGTPIIRKTPTTHYLRRAVSVDAWRGLADARRREKYVRVVRTKARAVGGSKDCVSPHFVTALASLAARQTPVLLAYGTDDEFYHRFEQVRPALEAALEAPDARIEVQVIPGKIHGLAWLAMQDAVADMTEEWLLRLRPADSREG